MKQRVLLPAGLAAHAHEVHLHKDPWHQMEGLVFVLLGIHLLAFSYLAFLLYKSRDRKRASSGRVTPGPSGPAKADWRSPRDILKAYQKTHLGKS